MVEGSGEAPPPFAFSRSVLKSQEHSLEIGLHLSCPGCFESGPD